MKTVTRGECTFHTNESGPAEGEVVLLLHGFPQHSDSWDHVVPLLNAAGFRTVTFDQRGYTPAAMPKRRRDYAIPQLAADAAAVIDAYGGRAHVVGHDWGAMVAWATATDHPERVASLTTVSVPHPRAFLKALGTSRQCLASWYILFFQLPWLPERALRSKWDWFLREYTGQSAEAAARGAAAFRDPASLTGPLNWYRGLPTINLWKQSGSRVAQPTLFVWSDGDVALKRKGAVNTERYVDGPYTFEVMKGVSHWIPEQAAKEFAELLVAHLQRHPIQGHP
ncbi:MAG: alpha/beta fold hydrolase [Sporichthyaceae bacterium]